jgi:hypothetical protein
VAAQSDRGDDGVLETVAGSPISNTAANPANETSN